MDKETYDGLIIATVMAANKKVKAGLRYAASGEDQDCPPGTLELGVALDAVDMVSNDVLNCILANQDEGISDTLNLAAAGFAVIANSVEDECIKEFALEQFHVIQSHYVHGSKCKESQVALLLKNKKIAGFPMRCELLVTRPTQKYGY